MPPFNVQFEGFLIGAGFGAVLVLAYLLLRYIDRLVRRLVGVQQK